MLRFLFPRLTDAPARGTDLFTACAAVARQPHWYVAGAVPDTIDGRFAMLTTIIALVSVRLEPGGEASAQASAALTERFVDAMDAEHRQLGIGEPTIGKTVRKLVSLLGKRVGQWRAALADPAQWDGAVNASVYRDSPADDAAAMHCAAELRALWLRLSALDDAAVAAGAFA